MDTEDTFKKTALLYVFSWMSVFNVCCIVLVAFIVKHCATSALERCYINIYISRTYPLMLYSFGRSFVCSDLLDNVSYKGLVVVHVCTFFQSLVICLCGSVGGGWEMMWNVNIVLRKSWLYLT